MPSLFRSDFSAVFQHDASRYINNAFIVSGIIGDNALDFLALLVAKAFDESGKSGFQLFIVCDRECDRIEVFRFGSI